MALTIPRVRIVLSRSATNFLLHPLSSILPLSVSVMSALPIRGAHVEELVGDDPDAELLHDELREEDEELQREVQHEMGDGADNDRLRQQEELMRLWLQQLAAQQAAAGGAPGGQQLIYPYRTAGAPEEEEEDESDVQATSAADESFVGWLRSSLLPSDPRSLLSSQSLWYYSRLSLLKLGQWGWMVGTASALALIPFFVASTAEDQKIRESNLIQQMEARMNFLEQTGGGAASVAGIPSGHVEIVQPRNAPPGYVPPPLEASGIPQA